MSKTISVITPVLNGEKHLDKAINSILAQTYPIHEILVVDGGSIDQTAAIAQSYPEVTLLQQSGTGLANARNTGIQAVTGEFVAFLDHDDLWHVDKLQQQITYFEQNPATQYVITQLKFVLEDGCQPNAAYTAQSFEMIHNGCTPSALLIRRSLFAEIGEFKEAFKIGCDADWFSRARDAKVSQGVIQQVLTYKCIHEGNLSGNVDTNRDELVEIVLQSLRRRRQRSKS
ncbi:MAG: glycosyltransferase family A protein [Cyanobacteria bacterium P01_H01_bin.15]